MRGVSFSTSQVAQLTGIPLATVGHLAATGVVMPSVAAASGPGTSRRYGFPDVCSLVAVAAARGFALRPGVLQPLLSYLQGAIVDANEIGEPLVGLDLEGRLSFGAAAFARNAEAASLFTVVLNVRRLVDETAILLLEHGMKTPTPRGRPPTKARKTAAIKERSAPRARRESAGPRGKRSPKKKLKEPPRLGSVVGMNIDLATAVSTFRSIVSTASVRVARRPAVACRPRRPLRRAALYLRASSNVRDLTEAARRHAAARGMIIDGGDVLHDRPGELRVGDRLKRLRRRVEVLIVVGRDADAVAETEVFRDLARALPVEWLDDRQIIPLSEALPDMEVA